MPLCAKRCASLCLCCLTQDADHCMTITPQTMSPFISADLPACIPLQATVARQLNFEQQGGTGSCLCTIPTCTVNLKYIRCSHVSIAGYALGTDKSTLCHALEPLSTHRLGTLQASILLFDGQSLDAVKRIPSNTTGFTCLTFSADGQRLVTTTVDRSLAIFDVTTGAPKDMHV